MRVLLVGSAGVVDAMRETVLAYFGEDVVIHTTNSGRIGYEMFVEFGADFVITEFMTPDLDGEQMSSLIRSVSMDTPIVMIAGSELPLRLPERFRAVINLDMDKLTSWFKTIKKAG